MNKYIKLTALASTLTAVVILSCSSVSAQESKQVWLANSPIFTVHNSAGGFTVAQRVNALQLRANSLLGERKSIPAITVRNSGTDSSIYVDNALFTTVTAADGAAYGSPAHEQANLVAERMRNILPKVRALHNPNNENLSSAAGWHVTLRKPQAYMSGNNLLVPFKQVMFSIDMPFTYNTTTRTIRANSRYARTQHTVGTSLAIVNGRVVKMNTASRITNGAIYVPSRYIELLTGKTAYWNQRSKILRID